MEKKGHCVFKQAILNIVKQPNRMISQLAKVVFIYGQPERITRQHALRQQTLRNVNQMKTQKRNTIQNSKR
jgi:hypothetical protein